MLARMRVHTPLRVYPTNYQPLKATYETLDSSKTTDFTYD